MEKLTTVQLRINTKKRLEELKITKRESIDSVVSRLVKMAIDDSPLTKDEIAGIKKSLDDIANKRVYKMKDVAKGLNLK
ncbi:MAG: hypothetical protein M1544_00115 [Candidatus Marsarchaeota archaeon]|nr:hypothetical protein [Candidatus Marsarchaeota archaeon]